MKFYLSCLIVAVVFWVAEGSNPSNTSTPTVVSSPQVKTTFKPTALAKNGSNSSTATTSGGTPSPSDTVTPSSSPILPTNSSSVSPSNASSVNHTSAISPSMTSASHPNMTSSMNQTVTQAPSTSTVVPPNPSASVTPSPTPTPADKHDDDGLVKQLWVSASFAIIFALTTVALAYCVFRQRRINEELRGDPATSRLL